MLRYLLFIVFVLLFPQTSYSAPGPTPTIAQDVAICDPYNPKSCLKPNYDGTLPIQGNIVATQPLYYPTGEGCSLNVTGNTPISIYDCSSGVPGNAKVALICNWGSAVQWTQYTFSPVTQTTGNTIGTGTPTNPVCQTFGPSDNTAITSLSFIEQTGTGTGILKISFWDYH